uniref:Peroxisomal biogenesis factor 5 n=1 Tax=Nephromyces sp. MMRI TaxID=2496275 RepID=A0A3S8V307_9APIC|nr:peroxisomal biogenesis factor 5 [Nephromyces sp. MMRI]
MRPNYPRAWTNLGVAHSNLGHYHDALRFYLTALSLNPEAVHLWFYVRAAITNLGQMDWIPLVDNRDINSLCALIPDQVVRSSQNLPSPANFNREAQESTIKKLYQVFQSNNGNYFQ